MESYEQIEWFCKLSPLAMQLIKLIKLKNRSLSLKWESGLCIYRLWQMYYPVLQGILQGIHTNYGEHYDMGCVHKYIEQ